MFKVEWRYGFFKLKSGAATKVYLRVVTWNPKAGTCVLGITLNNTYRCSSDGRTSNSGDTSLLAMICCQNQRFRPRYPLTLVRTCVYNDRGNGRCCKVKDRVRLIRTDRCQSQRKQAATNWMEFSTRNISPPRPISSLVVQLSLHTAVLVSHAHYSSHCCTCIMCALFFTLMYLYHMRIVLHTAVLVPYVVFRGSVGNHQSDLNQINTDRTFGPKRQASATYLSPCRPLLP